MEMPTPPTPANARIDPELRELAYGLWAGECGRSPAKVSAKLAAMGHEVDADTVSKWSMRHGWAARLDAELVTALPGMMRETATTLVSNGVIAARLYQEMLYGFHETREVPSKDALALVTGALDRAGFSPVGRGEPPTSRAGSGGQDRRGIHRWLTEADIEKITAIPQ